MPIISTTAPIFGRAETSGIIATIHTATWMKNSYCYSSYCYMDFRKTVIASAFAIIQSYNGTSPKASTVTPTTERTAFRNSSLLIRTCKPVTCIRGRDSPAQMKATPKAARLAPVVGKNHSLTRNGISASQLGTLKGRN